MLDLSSCLQDLCTALEDNSPEHEWWFDPRTGALESRSYSYYYDEQPDRGYPGDRGFVLVDPIKSGDAYRDMQEFVQQVTDHRAHDVLSQAIAGRGAFRRFKDALVEFPELRGAWFRFHDARVERRAIGWLCDHELISREEADAAVNERPDPDLPRMAAQPEGQTLPIDARAIATAVARDLREFYGERLRDVILFGSHAQGESDPESDIDLLVVLDEVRPRRGESLRMAKVLSRHSLANDTMISAIPVSEAEYHEATAPILAAVRAEGFSVL